MQRSKWVIAIVDNSVSFTGALKCAVQQASLMKEEARYVFVLPKNSSAVGFVHEQGFKVYTLPMQEIRKSLPALLRYPMLLSANAYRLKRIIKQERAGVIVMNDFYNLLGVMVKALGAKSRLITYVRLLPHVMPGPLRKLWIGAAIRYADGIIAVSDAVLSQLPKSEKVQRIYDAVLLPEVHPPFRVRETHNEINLLYLGNYIRGKGHDYALKAFALAYAKNPKLRLRFYGGDMGLEKNKAFRRELEEVVRQQRLEGVVSFHPFAKDTEQVYKGADIFLNFSEAESFSMTCAEAAYFGIPTIASRCGGPEEIIDHGATGLLVANKDVEAMSEAIQLLSSDKELQEQFAKSSPAFVRERFGALKFQNQFRSVISTGEELGQLLVIK